MNFLSKIGKIVGQVLTTWSGIAPIVRGFLPPDVQGKILPIMDTILEVRDVIITVEEIAALSSLEIRGAEKLRIAGPLVGKVILRSTLVANKKVKDPELFKQGTTAVASGMADILNSLDDDMNEINHG